MRRMEELKNMLCDELDKITKKGELSAGSLDVIDKLTHSIKSIETIMAMESSGYSNTAGYSYARNSSARRDSMGRYSRDDARHDLIDKLHELSTHANDETTKEMIRHWIRQAEMD